MSHIIFSFSFFISHVIRELIQLFQGKYQYRLIVTMQADNQYLKLINICSKNKNLCVYLMSCIVSSIVTFLGVV